MCLHVMAFFLIKDREVGPGLGWVEDTGLEGGHNFILIPIIIVSKRGPYSYYH